MGEVDGEIKFPRPYLKLTNKHFTAIRESDKDLQHRDIVNIYIEGEKISTAVVRGVNQKKVEDISAKVLRDSTSTDTKEEALEELKERHPNLSEDSIVHVIELMWTLYEVIPMKVGDMRARMKNLK